MVITRPTVDRHATGSALLTLSAIPAAVVLVAAVSLLRAFLTLDVGGLLAAAVVAFLIVPTAGTVTWLLAWTGVRLRATP